MDQSIRLRFLFDKYLERACTNQEMKELILLLQQAHAEASLTGPMQALWMQLQEDTGDYEVDWNAMFEKAIRQPVAAEDMHRFSARKKTMLTAFSLVMLASAIITYHFLSLPRTKKEQVPATASISKPSQKQPAGRQTIHLPDGSTVVLNADSKLDYPPAFTGKSREVYLSGEAFFDITHLPRQPFLVHAGKIITKVLGTAFDIRAYPADESVEVTVTRGKVQVLTENRALGLVGANQQISFSKKTDLFIQKTVNAAEVTAWKPEALFFDDITMGDAAATIEQRFNVSVSFENPAIKNCRITASFSGDEMIGEILTVICGVSKSEFRMQQQKITISGKGCTD